MTILSESGNAVPPRLAARALHLAERDARWFRAHPHRTTRVRLARAVEAEVLTITTGGPPEPPREGEARFVAIRRAAAGACHYQFFLATADLDCAADDATSADLYDRAGDGRPLDHLLARHLDDPFAGRPTSPPELEAVIEGDRRFFERHRTRSHRMRLTGAAEIAANARAGFHMGPPRAGACWITVVHQVRPGFRLKAWCQLPEEVDTDAPEAVCADLYRALTGKAGTVAGGRMLPFTITGDRA